MSCCVGYTRVLRHSVIESLNHRRRHHHHHHCPCCRRLVLTSISIGISIFIHTTYMISPHYQHPTSTCHSQPSQSLVLAPRSQNTAAWFFDPSLYTAINTLSADSSHIKLLSSSAHSRYHHRYPLRLAGHHGYVLSGYLHSIRSSSCILHWLLRFWNIARDFSPA